MFFVGVILLINVLIDGIKVFVEKFKRNCKIFNWKGVCINVMGM